MDKSSSRLPFSYAFGPFRLDPERRRLERSGRKVALRPRAFDILVTLVQERDRVVTREDFTSGVWQGVNVTENTLTTHIWALRRALGDTGPEHELIATVPGRGYRFVGQVAKPPILHNTEDLVALEPPVETVPAVEIKPGHLSLWRNRYAIVAGLFGAAAVTVLAWLLPWRTASMPALSIAVMPFADLSGGESNAYIAEAVTADLTTEVAHIPGSLVIDYRSAATFRGRAVAPAEIGATLNVRYLLQGSVRTDGSALRINAVVVDTQSGQHVWDDGFTVDCACRLLTAQEQLVNRVARALEPALVTLAADRSAVERPNDGDAVALFLRARSILDHDNSPSGWDQAGPMLEQAIAKAPRFPEALSALGVMLVNKIEGPDDPDDDQDHRRAREVITQAYNIAPMNATVLVAEGRLLEAERNCAAAMPMYKNALYVEPTNVKALSGEAICALTAGRPDQAIPLLQETLRLDPLNPHVHWRYERLAESTFKVGQFDSAIQWLQREGITTLDPASSQIGPGTNQLPYMYLIAAHDHIGDKKRAAEMYRAFAQIWPHRSFWRIMEYLDKGDVNGPGTAALRTGMLNAGMPEFADENVAPQTPLLTGGDFESTPLEIPGGKRVTTAQVKDLLARDPATMVADVGMGAGVIPSAYWRPWQQFTTDKATMVEAEVKRRLAPRSDRPIIVMGDGPYGGYSYNVATRLIALGYRNVLWYRGGEESWVAAGLPSEDRRMQ
jgi:DNA-binding winged helix-turn-helix (wHTH) protein/TolB-like protein/rhodanese-related sulfurtransferase